MKNPAKMDGLKYLILGAGGLGLVLRILLYTTGMDGRGLLVRGHWTATVLSILTVAVLLVLFLATRNAAETSAYEDAYPVSILRAVGAFAAMIGFGVTTVQEFATFSSRLQLMVWLLGLCSALSMAIIGLFRLKGKKPPFLLHAAVCLYFALRMVVCYQQWSSNPQLQDYGYYLGAFLALMLASYQHAAFDAAMGKHRALWFCSLVAVYLCCLSLKGTTDTILLLGSGIWAFTNLTSQKPCAAVDMCGDTCPTGEEG